MFTSPAARRTWTGAALALSLGLGGCKGALPPCACADPSVQGCGEPDYLLVESTSGVTVGTPRPAELSATPAYDAVLPRLTSVAIRLPDSCNQEGAATVSGQSKQAELIVRTQCGVWLSELEKALVGSNLRVVSWDALRGLERSRNLPAYAAAAELGADIVLIFNSLDASDVLAGTEVAARHRYFRSNSEGAALEPAVLAEPERAPLRQFAVTRLQAMQSALTTNRTVIALSSTLDVTAVMARDLTGQGAAPVPEAVPPGAPPAAVAPARTGAGEAVWFFRQTTLKPLRDAIGWRFLFEKINGAWFPTAPPHRPPPPEQKAISYSAEDNQAGGIAAGTDPYATERLELVRMVAREFVARFRGKAGG